MSSQPKIVYPDAEESEIQIYAPLFARLERISNFEVYAGKPPDEEEYVRRIDGANAILLGWDISGSVMQSDSNLEVISFTGIGVEKFVDMEQARNRGITICNCPGYADSAVAEHAMALLLAVARHVPKLHDELKAGNWNQSLVATELRGKTIGLIGFGGIAKYFSRLCASFGMHVLVWARNPQHELEQEFGVRFCDLDELYASCDIVSLHLAANSETLNFVDHQAFQKMKNGVIFINTARAEIVDESAMLDALDSSLICAAGLDVFHREPLNPDNPLLSMANVVLSPHIAYNTPEATWRLFDIGVTNLEQYFAGDPINVVV